MTSKRRENINLVSFICFSFYVEKMWKKYAYEKKSRNPTVTQTSMEFLDPTLIYEEKLYVSFFLMLSLKAS